MKIFAALLIVPALMAAETTKPAPIAVKAFSAPTGTFTLSQTPDLPQGIELAAEGVPFLMRGYAEKRLTDVNPAYRRVVLSHDDSSVSIQFDGRKPVRVPLKGGTAWTREDGETFWVNASASPSQIVQTYKAKDGERINEFTLSPSGESLLLKVSVRSPRLSKVLYYSLVYSAAK
ncbi:MAG: hypothetical protein IPP78_04420 [Holophagaceae bacterium]|nr:hypothetical protein [Holophagaceae bacterium]